MQKHASTKFIGFSLLIAFSASTCSASQPTQGTVAPWTPGMGHHNPGWEDVPNNTLKAKGLWGRKPDHGWSFQDLLLAASRVNNQSHVAHPLIRRELHHVVHTMAHKGIMTERTLNDRTRERDHARAELAQEKARKAADAGGAHQLNLYKSWMKGIIAELQRLSNALDPKVMENEVTAAVRAKVSPGLGAIKANVDEIIRTATFKAQ